MCGTDRRQDKVSGSPGPVSVFTAPAAFHRPIRWAGTAPVYGELLAPVLWTVREEHPKGVIYKDKLTGNEKTC